MGTPPSIDGTTTGSVVQGTGDLVNGDLDDVGGNNAGDTWSIQTGSTYGTASIDPATGAWTYNLDDTNAAVIALTPGDTLIDTFTVQVTDIWGTDTQVVTITINGAPCFMAGTHIETAEGPRLVETLHVGDLVFTDDFGLQPLRWIGGRKVSHAEMKEDEKKRPIRIAKNAFGKNLPVRDLLVSRQHRVLVQGTIVEQLYGVQEAFLPAVRLLGIPGVEVILPDHDIEFIHLLFDQHQVVFAEGIGSESFLFGKQARLTLDPDSVLEIVALFPSAADQLRLSQAARHIPPLKTQKDFALTWRPDHGPLAKAFDRKSYGPFAATG
ncbi:MAG: Hint domain-containing protein [Marinosulfonomonas sp.]